MSGSDLKISSRFSSEYTRCVSLVIGLSDDQGFDSAEWQQRLFLKILLPENLRQQGDKHPDAGPNRPPDTIASWPRRILDCSDKLKRASIRPQLFSYGQGGHFSTFYDIEKKLILADNVNFLQYIQKVNNQKMYFRYAQTIHASLGFSSPPRCVENGTFFVPSNPSVWPGWPAWQGNARQILCRDVFAFLLSKLFFGNGCGRGETG
jgi:hypothetical protein